MLATGIAMSVVTAAPLTATIPEEQPTPERALLHSDLPIFGGETSDKWPQSFRDGEDFGCASRVRFGDWTLREDGGTPDDDAEWWRISNYGVFHCWANVATAHGLDDLAGAAPRPSFFVPLGRVGERDLWVLQMGARPGSDYLLLARTPSEGPIDRFDVLQIICPKRMRRGGKAIDILLTNYCAVANRRELIALARTMASKPRFGELRLVSEPPTSPASTTLPEPADRAR